MLPCPVPAEIGKLFRDYSLIDINSASRPDYKLGAEVQSKHDEQSGNFKDHSSSATKGAQYTQSRDKSEPETSIRDRIAYPFHAIMNRVNKYSYFFSSVFVVVGFSIHAFVGCVAGGVVGGIVKLAKMIGGHDSDAHKLGAAIGATVCCFVGLPVVLALSVVGAAAGLVIGTAGSVVALPVDIYRAVTLDKSDLNPWAEEEKCDMEHIKGQINELTESILRTVF